MNNAEYYNGVDKLLNEFMKQIGKLVLQDYGLLNDVCMETTKRKLNAPGGDLISRADILNSIEKYGAEQMPDMRFQKDFENAIANHYARVVNEIKAAPGMGG